MLLPAGLRESAQQWGIAATHRNAQLINVIRAALALERRYADEVTPGALKTVHELGIRREIRIIQRLVVERDGIQTMGVEPTTGWFQDGERGVERRESGESFKAQFFTGPRLE